MSRVGKKPITIPQGVTAQFANGIMKVKGPKGELVTLVHSAISVSVDAKEILVSRTNNDGRSRALHGTTRANIANTILGVTEGFSKKLELVGVGYRAELKGKVIQLALGYSHPIVFRAPEGIKIEVPIQTNIIISGNDKQLVGLVAAKIRSFREPEPYKGKGVKYSDEFIRRKAGKTAASGAK